VVNEIYTYTGQRVYDEVSARFDDLGAAQINTDMVLRWINDGIRSVVAQNPFLKQTAQTDIVAAQGTYLLSTAFPTARIMQYDTISVNNAPMEMLPWPEFQRRIRGEDRTKTGSPVLATEYGGTISLWPVPTEDATNGLVVYFTAYPPDVAALDTTLPVPDRFYNALRDYVFAQALELDENWEAASSKMRDHQDSLTLEFGREDRSPTDFYPTITDTEGGEAYLYGNFGQVV
jgi:hypothetical protein